MEKELQTGRGGWKRAMDGYLGRQIHKGKMSAKRIIQVDEVLDEDKKKDTTRAENRKLHKDC